MSEKSSTRIAVVGPTQAGKTCLAVGLFSTNTSGFTIEAVNDESRQYLADLKIALRPAKDNEVGVWPEASNLGTNKSLSFDFLKTGKSPIRVEFPEYSGEMLQSDKIRAWANEHLRGLNGVVLLVNPGAEAFQKGDQRLFEDVIGQYEYVLSFMRDPVNESSQSFVALTVTAADRINGGDLMVAGKLNLFNECIRRLSNTLGTSGFRWKRFDVTITGYLKDQSRPTLAEGRKNSASIPFLWLLDKLHWLPIRQKILTIVLNCALAIAGLAVLCGIGFGVHAWNVSESIDNEKTKLEKAIRDCKNRNDLENIRNMLVALQSRPGLFAGKAKRLVADLEPLAWNVFEAQLTKEMNTIRGNPEKYGSPSDCNRVDSIFTLWAPQSTKCQKKRSGLESQWKVDKPDWQDRYAIAQMNESVDKKLNNLAAKHGGEVVKSLYGLYGEMKNLNPCSEKTQKSKEDLFKSLDERVAKEFLEHLIPEFNDKSYMAKEKIEEHARQLRMLLSDWDPHGDSYRETKEGIESQVNRVATTKTKDWGSQKRKECEEWIDRAINSRPDRKGHELIREYTREKRNHRGHEDIFNETIRRAVYLHCERCFEKDIAFFKKNYDNRSECENRFNTYFKDLCKAIVEDTEDPDEVSWAIRFAKGCVDIGKVKDGFENAFKERFEITSVNGKIYYCGRDPLKRFQGAKFGLDVFRTSNEGHPSTILKCAESPVVKNNDNTWYKLQGAEGWSVNASFADPLNFVMSIHDDRSGLEVDYRRNYKDKDVNGFHRAFSPFYANPSDGFSIELGGTFGKQTPDRQLAAYVQVNLKRVSGLGICAILSKAKEACKPSQESSK